MNSIKGFLKTCLCCFKKQKITNDVLCDSPPKDKKTKNKKFLSCFTVRKILILLIQMKYLVKL